MTQDLSFFVKQAIEAPVHLTFRMENEQFPEYAGDLVLSDPPSEIQGELVVEKIQGGILVTGSMTGTIFVPCSRCLEATVVKVAESIHFVLLPAPAYSGKEIELGQDDLDVIHYSGDQVDLEPHVWDQMILSIPRQPLCKEDCPGIPVSDSPAFDGNSSCETGFAVLKALSLKQPEGVPPAR